MWLKFDRKITEIDVISTSEKCLKIKSYYQKNAICESKKYPFNWPPPLCRAPAPWNETVC